jgi:hypothetical protein
MANKVEEIVIGERPGQGKNEQILPSWNHSNSYLCSGLVCYEFPSTNHVIYSVSSTKQRLATSVVFVLIKKLNSVALIRERTIPTERQPLIGEVSANVCG